MTITEIALWRDIQRHLADKLGIELRPDGDPGGATARAVAQALGLIRQVPAAEVAVAQWPKDRWEEMYAFYGQPGTNLIQIVPPYPLKYDGKVVPKITVHEKIAPAVLRVLQKVLDYYGLTKIKALKLDVYDGCFNNRPKRGGTSLSTHAYGCAIDFCAEDNLLKQDHRTARFAKPEYEAWWRFWEEEGAVSLGRARDFDWMHVQFARL